MCVFVWETHQGVTLSWFLLLASGSETHTAAGAAEHSLQRNDQVSDAAQQRGAGMASYSGLVALQLLSHRIKSRFTTLQMAWDWPSNPEARGREGSLTKPDINISWADYTRCWKTSTNNQISSRQINQRDIFQTVSWPQTLQQLFKFFVSNTKWNMILQLHWNRSANRFKFGYFFVYYIFTNLQKSVIAQLNAGYV